MANPFEEHYSRRRLFLPKEQKTPQYLPTFEQFPVPTSAGPESDNEHDAFQSYRSTGLCVTDGDH